MTTISCIKGVFFIYMAVVFLPCDNHRRSKMCGFKTLELCTDELYHEQANITTIGDLVKSLTTFDEMTFDFGLFAKEIGEVFSEIGVGSIEVGRDIAFSVVRSLPDFPKVAQRLVFYQGISHNFHRSLNNYFTNYSCI